MTLAANKSISLKICGISRVEDACFAYAAGANAIGMIFYPPSPRDISLEQGAKIVTALGPLCHTVAVTVDMAGAELEKLVAKTGINTLQFHGKESPDFCDQFGLPYFKVIRMKAGIDLQAKIDQYPNARGILLDTYVKGIVGGTGQSFDWQSVAKLDDPRVIVAGGLNAETINQAISASQAQAFDVSSGVESSPGIKSHDKISQLFKQIKNGH